VFDGYGLLAATGAWVPEAQGSAFVGWWPGCWGGDYTTNQMTYDLRRLRLHGLIERVPKTTHHVLTPEGLRVAVFYTKLHGQLLRPLVAAGNQPPAPVELRRARRNRSDRR